VAHIGVTDTASFVRANYTTLGLQQNSSCKRRVMNLTIERKVGDMYQVLAIFLLLPIL
jgi:hypothetical protein